MAKIKKNVAPILHCDGSWSDPWTLVPESCSRAIIIAGNGILQLKRVKALDYTLVEAATIIAPGSIDFLESFKPYCRVSVPDKIPFDDIRRIQSFFRDVTDSEKVECSLFILWSPIERTFKVVPPKDYQDISKTHITSVFPDVPTGYIIFGRIHCHVDFKLGGNGFSGEDDNGNKTDGFYLVIGNNATGQVPDYACSVVVDGRRYQLTPDQIIAGLEQVEYPEDEWWAPVRKALERQKAEEARRQAQAAVAVKKTSFNIGVHSQYGGRE